MPAAANSTPQLMQLQLRSGGQPTPGGAAAPGGSAARQCLTAVASTSWCPVRSQCNDELDVRPCDATGSDHAQQWVWDAAGTAGVIQSHLDAAEVTALWAGRPGRCEAPPCCLTVNGNKAPGAREC